MRTLQATQKELQKMGHDVRVIGPDAARFMTIAMPFYPEIKLEFLPHRRLALLLRDFAPDFIHIATEGPLGWAMRGLCLRSGRPFTTSYHTQFPEYLAKRAPRGTGRLVCALAYSVLRRFHAPAGAVMVATPTVERQLAARKFRRLVRWSRGVDTTLFKPYGKNNLAFDGVPRPLLLNVGRVSVEKNLRAFLDLKTPGSKIVIGDGPDLARLKVEYPEAQFLAPLQGEALARHYAAVDLFVFPSKTDTFGLVLLEAAAAGLRIAAFPVAGPADVLGDAACADFAILDNDLQRAVERALLLSDNPDKPSGLAARFSWQACTAQFYTHLQAPSPKATRRLARWLRKIGESL